MPIQYIPQDPYDPMGLGLGQGIAQGLSRFANQWALGKDMNALQLWAASQLPQGQAGPQMGFPAMGHPMMQQLAAQNMMGNIFRDPLETLEALKLQRDIEKPYYQPGVIENIETGEQRPYRYGDEIPEGFKIVREAQTVVNIGREGLTPTTQTRLQEAISNIDDKLTMIDEIDNLTEDAFLTYRGRAKAYLSSIGEKAELAKASDYLKKYSAWKSVAQDLYLKKRHDITGVAARPEEKIEIAQAIPDPTKNSFSEFMAKSQQLRKILNAHKKRYEFVLSEGIINPTKEQLAQYSLEQFKQDNISNRSIIKRPTKLLSDEEINNMSLEEVEKALAQIEGNTANNVLAPDLTKPKTSLEKNQQQNQMADFRVSESEMRQIINELPAPLKSKINKLSATHRSRIWQRLGNLGIENWNILTPKQKTQTIMRIINETRK